MPKDTKSSGYNKAPACESRGFGHKKEGENFDTPSSSYVTEPMLFQRNLIRCLSLLGINQISIDLSSGDILMRQHLRYCVNVCT